jgi:hypothetical protein
VIELPAIPVALTLIQREEDVNIDDWGASYARLIQTILSTFLDPLIKAAAVSCEGLAKRLL